MSIRAPSANSIKGSATRPNATVPTVARIKTLFNGQPKPCGAGAAGDTVDGDADAEAVPGAAERDDELDLEVG